MHQRKATPAARVQLVLRTLQQLLDKEYQYIYGHNLGVQSGTAVIEDVQVQRVRALCSRITAMVAHDSSSADAMVLMCKKLTPQQFNRLQTTFDSLDMEQVTDFLRISIFHTSCIFRQTPQAAAALAQLDETSVKQAGRLQGSTRIPARSHNQGTRHEASGSLDTQHNTLHAGNDQNPVPKTAPPEGAPAPPPPPMAMRYETLRQSGHPFVQIADKLLVVRSLLHLHIHHLLMSLLAPCCTPRATKPETSSIQFAHDALLDPTGAHGVGQQRVALPKKKSIQAEAVCRSVLAVVLLRLQKQIETGKRATWHTHWKHTTPKH